MKKKYNKVRIKNPGKAKAYGVFIDLPPYPLGIKGGVGTKIYKNVIEVAVKFRKVEKHYTLKEFTKKLGFK